MRLLLGGFLRLGFGSVGEKRRLRRHRLLWGIEETGAMTLYKERGER